MVSSGTRGVGQFVVAAQGLTAPLNEGFRLSSDSRLHVAPPVNLWHCQELRRVIPQELSPLGRLRPYELWSTQPE